MIACGPGNLKILYHFTLILRAHHSVTISSSLQRYFFLDWFYLWFLLAAFQRSEASVFQTIIYPPISATSVNTRAKEKRKRILYGASLGASQPLSMDGCHTIPHYTNQTAIHTNSNIPYQSGNEQLAMTQRRR